MNLEKLQAELAGEVDSSVLEMLDHLLDKGCVITGSLVLGLAEVDLVYVELSLLACAAERVLGTPEERAERTERTERMARTERMERTERTERNWDRAEARAPHAGDRSSPPRASAESASDERSGEER